MNQKTLRFNKREIASLPPAENKKRDYYQDPRTPGLRLAVTDKGSKSWVLQRRVNGRVKRITLGRFPDMTPENAVKRLHATLGQLAQGVDPQTTDRRTEVKRVTLHEVLDQYLQARTTLKASTVKSYRQTIEVGLKDWCNTPVRAITKDMVAERHRQLTEQSGPGYANMVMRTLKAVWNFAAGVYEDEHGESLLPSNPVQRLSKTRSWNRTKPRTTVIRSHQLPDWFGAVEKLRAEPWGTPAQTVGDYLEVLILTGMRRTEGASLRWDGVDLKGKSFTLVDTKNREDHTLPLSDYLADLLKNRFKHRPDPDSPFVFPGNGQTGHMVEFRAYTNRVTRDSGVPFRLHDLRRTFITVAESCDVPAYALSQLANHKLGHAVTRDYIVMDYERLREPMQRITDQFLTLAQLR
ncbi:tyrosine-type recombinase/integrase [Salinisphaera sp. SPP-AMP-43]|uniref:tyrosine-type recombinase/integrase n=1 Tax=Salinisphaera sp. SPP-AMP-43 TaxID=3121288 RepID=UPI003C6DE721